MNISPRRTLSTILVAALLLGSVPQEVSAQIARVAAGEMGGMPVSPGASTHAPTFMAPALGIGAASLNGNFSASSISPSPVAVKTAVAPIALSIVIRAAASEGAPNLPNAPKATALVETKTWGQRLASMFGRKPTPAKTPAAAAPSSEAAKASADQTFDGATEKEATPEGVPVSAVDIKITHTGLKASLINRLTLSQEKRKLHVDEFGGPLAEPMNFKQRVGYGLKQGLNLVGIGALLTMTLRPMLDLFPWPQHLTDATLRGFGRVALLTKYGPNEIGAALANSPATFLGISLPMAVTMEEIAYRLFGFGLTFLVLAAVKPFTRWISSMIEGLPDAAGVVGGTKRVLKIGELLSHLAFPIAAAISSLSFAAAHFATWGFSPFVLALNTILGLYLAHTAYKSRSLTSPVIAHLVFNLVMIGGMLVAMSFSPFSGAAFAIIAGLIGVASLLHSYLSARKERALRLKNGGKALTALMIVALSLSVFNGMTYNPVNEAASRTSASTVIQQIKGQKTETAGKLPVPVVAAPADSAAVESRADMVARVKPSVVKVIVHMPNGYGIGSGFILTPKGLFVTNGHVVGDKQPGDIINAYVPGIPGELKAKALAINHDKDLAIVQLQPRPDGKPWPFVKLAQTAPREGEEVTAIGYPRGLPFTVTKGVVSGIDGRGSMYVRMLQTDAAINPGNSGGPLFNDKGEVIGVNTEIRTESGGSEGLGFSIQSPEVAHVMAQYAHTGNIATAFLGIIANLSDPMAPDAGLEIEYVRHGSAAEKTGLVRGDLLIGIGEQMIKENGREAAGHVAAILSKMMPGQTTTITVLRGDKPVELKLTVGAKTTTAPNH